MLSMPQAHALGAHLAGLHRTTIVEPDDAPARVARAILSALGHGVPALASLVASLEVRASRVSVTLPTPGGSLVILSPAAVVDPLRYAVTVAHELVHAEQRDAAGAVQVAADYLAAPELRARAEADAYAVGLFVAYLLTGVLPAIDDAVASLSSDTYHLAPDEVELGRGVLLSHVETIAQGLAPPLRVAVEALAWLRANAPASIVGRAL
jgi:hypothetical protein